MSDKAHKYGISIPVYFEIFVDAEEFDKLKYGEDEVYLEKCLRNKLHTFGGQFHVDANDVSYADFQITETIYKNDEDE